MDRLRTTQLLLNLGHAFDHLVMLIFPTVVIALAPEFGRSYGEMLGLSFGGFLAFGAGSLPAGWLGDRWSRRGMMIVFFCGIGLASIATGLAGSPAMIAAGLTAIGLFAAIYHPVGIAMLVVDPARIGRDLGINGVYGNLGVAFAALIAGGLTWAIGWRAAFIVPGIVAVGLGIAFAALVPPEYKGSGRGRTVARLDQRTMVRIFGVLLVATVCGGVIFNATTIAMPKIFDERLTGLTHTTFGVGAFVCAVYVLAAMAQLCVGQLIDRYPLRNVFLPVAGFQAPLLLLAVSLQDWAMLAVAFGMMFFIFGQIPINDAMIARYTDEGWRSRVYAVRYVVSFGASSLSVPLVALTRDATGGFERLFLVLGVVALPTLAAALFFPRHVVRGTPEAAAPARA
jgi:MFS family permease